MSEPTRRRLSKERKGWVHRVEIEGGHKVYIRVGLYENGEPGEIFIDMSKEGSTLSGLLDTIAVQTSLLLQNGVSLKFLVAKFVNTRFEPCGRTNNPCIPQTTSIVDYVFRWLGMKFLSLEELANIGVTTKCHECGKGVRRDDATYACTAHPPQET